MSDEFFDLIVWYEPTGEIHGFQLCYDKSECERALTWTPSRGFNHGTVDTGESEPNANRSPTVEEGGEFPFDIVLHEFRMRSEKIESEICEFVADRIMEYARLQLG